VLSRRRARKLLLFAQGGQRLFAVLAREPVEFRRWCATSPARFSSPATNIDKKIRSLSGGAKTRLVIARMLLHPPNFLVLIE